MKIKRAHLWAAGRILLAVVLLTIVFRYLIPMRDTVGLGDGTEVTGAFIEQRADVVVIDTAGGALVIAHSDIARDENGELKIARGFIPLLKKMTLARYLIGMFMLGLIPSIASLRWRTLMRAQGIPMGFWRALELTYLGLFCNNFMPGLTGGDLAKAYYASKLTSTRKTSAVVTVFLDRLIGIVMLATVAGVAVCVTLVFPLQASSEAYTRAAYLVAAFVAFSMAGIIAFFSRPLRALGRRIIKAMPGHDRLRSHKLAQKAVALIRKIDGAIFLYRDRKRVLLYAVGLSVVAHSSAITGIFFFGKALGVTEARLVSCFVAVPVAFIVSSIPVAPAGWGIGEVAFKTFFGAVGVGAAAAVTISVVYRLTQALWTLPGGIILMIQKERPTFEEVEEEMEEAGERLQEEIQEQPDAL